MLLIEVKNMKDKDKTREQILNELQDIRKQFTDLKKS